jgi:hypothetical protein
MAQVTLLGCRLLLTSCSERALKLEPMLTSTVA